MENNIKETFTKEFVKLTKEDISKGEIKNFVLDLPIGKFEHNNQFKAVIKIPATETKKEGRYIDMASVRSIHSIMNFIGFDYITLSELVKLVMKK